MAEGPRMETCPACDGDRWVPCDCHLCRSPEGRACGVMGHVDRRCPVCEGRGEVEDWSDAA